MPPHDPTKPAEGDATRLFLFAGGGTGGHLFPTLAIAERLRDLLGDGCRCQFLCSNRAIDASILAREGAAFSPVPAAPPALRPMGMLRFLRGWGPSVRIGREQIRAGRRTGAGVVLIASGGFVAAPLAQAARAERCPIVMLNLDALPGKANRWIARHATRIFTTAPVAERAWEVIPPIVRRSALPAASPGECRREFGLDPDRRTLLVTGGSLGAASINGFLRAFVEAKPRALAGWQVIHQTGSRGGARETEAADVRRAYEAAGVAAHVTPFLERMGAAWGATDLCVCRAGAGNVAEAWATRTPCLFLPYPFHKDGHQRANAMPLVERSAAVLAHDAVDPQANMGEAGAALAELLGGEEARGQLRAGLAALGPADGAERVAKALAAMV